MGGVLLIGGLIGAAVGVLVFKLPQEPGAGRSAGEALLCDLSRRCWRLDVY